MMIINLLRSHIAPATKFVLFFCLVNISFSTEAQDKHFLKGSITNGSSHKPVDFAVVIVKEAHIVSQAPQGTYFFSVEKAGKYTITVQSNGFISMTTTVTIEGSVTQNFVLTPETKQRGITIRGDRDLQNISRHTMTQRQIKEVPASFGDSINALATLPGVNRPMGFFGPLIIRGANDNTNGYFVDDIPLLNPMHFGAIHSVINNDLMSEIDLYSSAYPSQFGNCQSAVININTIDEVQKFGGNIEIGLLSANSLIKAPITSTDIVDGKAQETQKGYVIAAGRYGYLSLFVPLFYKLIVGETLETVPEYWDYQFKAKYNLNSNSSLTLLTFGNKDFIHAIQPQEDPGDDPVMIDAVWHQDTQSHGQGLYYKYKNNLFSNTLMGYSVFNTSYFWLDVPRASTVWARDFGIDSHANIFSLKDKLNIDIIKNHVELRGGFEFSHYRFSTKGKIMKTNFEGDTFDPNDPAFAHVESISELSKNYLITGYSETKLSLGGFSCVPGVHVENLRRTKTTVVDPRGTASYSFSSGTTLAVAGGWYSKFIQPNTHFFAVIFAPDISSDDALKPQRSIHRSGSIEQKVDKYTFKAEGFYNNFWDNVIYDPWTDDTGKEHQYNNRGTLKTYGVELLAKIGEESDQGLFGWINYTWNRSRYWDMPDVTKDYGKQWTDSWYEMTHVMKAVAGYTLGKHTLSARFQYNTTTPYTPIVGSYSDDAFTASYGKPRNVPLYGKTNSEKLSPSYRLDLRYSYKTSYRWGTTSWFIEAMNATMHKEDEYYWDYRKPYGENNPRVRKQSGLSIIPNFGVEVKF